MDFILNNINYIGSVIIFTIGIYTVLTHSNLLKKIIGINIMETAVFLLFVSIGYVQYGNSPMVANIEGLVVNPLPSAMILTGIVVAISITAYGLSLIIRIYEVYGTIDLMEIYKLRGVDDE